MPVPSPRPRSRSTTNCSWLAPPSPAATAADRCGSCGCWRQRLRSARHHGSHRDELLARSAPSAVQRRMRGLARPIAMPRSCVRHPSDFSMQRSSTSAFERVALTADVPGKSLRQHRNTPIAIAPLPSTTTAAHAAVSSPEACPTPAPGRRTPTPVARSGSCPTTLNTRGSRVRMPGGDVRWRRSRPCPAVRGRRLKFWKKLRSCRSSPSPQRPVSARADIGNSELLRVREALRSSRAAAIALPLPSPA